MTKQHKKPTRQNVKVLQYIIKQWVIIQISVQHKNLFNGKKKNSKYKCDQSQKKKFVILQFDGTVFKLSNISK